MNIQQIHLKIHTGIMINLKKKNIYICYQNITTLLWYKKKVTENRMVETRIDS